MAFKTFGAVVQGLLFLLAGCGQSSAPALSSAPVLKSGDNKDGFNVYVDSLCDEIGGGGARAQFTADTTCVGCSAEAEANAVDGTDTTFATLTFASGTQGPLNFRATAQQGIVYPAGSRPAVTFSAPRNESFSR